MDKLSARHLQMQGNVKKTMMFSCPSNDVRRSLAIRKVVSDCRTCKQSNPRKDFVGIRMCMNSDNLSPRKNQSFGEMEGMNNSSGEQKKEEDWRSFRARMVNANLSGVSGKKKGRRNINIGEWGYEIENIEEGCVLVATEKLKNHPLFSESVVLVLKWPVNSSRCKGIVLNKMFPCVVGSMDLVDPMIRNLIVPAYVGGPAMEGSDFGSKFHLLTREEGVAGFECILPGLYAGNVGVALQSAMSSAAAMRLYVGEVELEKRVARAQVEAFGWWKIVACSADVIFSTTFSTPQMWYHVNHLLRGQEMSLNCV